MFKRLNILFVGCGPKNLMAKKKKGKKKRRI